MRKRLGDKTFTLGARLPSASPEKERQPSVFEVAEVDGWKNEMWTDRYKPRNFTDLVGNKGVIS